jgi:hypothetical protein
MPALKVCSTEAALDLEALESVMVDENSPILRAKPASRPSHKSDMKLREESGDLDPRATLPDITTPRGWRDLGTSNANDSLQLVPDSNERAALAAFAAAEKPKNKTERRVKSVEPRPVSKRVKKRAQELSHNNLLVLAGPALLFICGLLLLFH